MCIIRLYFTHLSDWARAHWLCCGGLWTSKPGSCRLSAVSAWRSLGTGRHGSAASTWTRRNRCGWKKTRHRWHSASDHDHHRPKPGRGASKVGAFLFYYKPLYCFVQKVFIFMLSHFICEIAYSASIHTLQQLTLFFSSLLSTHWNSRPNSNFSQMLI